MDDNFRHFWIKYFRLFVFKLLGRRLSTASNLLKLEKHDNLMCWSGRPHFENYL